MPNLDNTVFQLLTSQAEIERCENLEVCGIDVEMGNYKLSAYRYDSDAKTVIEDLYMTKDGVDTFYDATAEQINKVDAMFDAEMKRIASDEYNSIVELTEMQEQRNYESYLWDNR